MGENGDIKFLAYIREPTATLIVNNEVVGFHGTWLRGKWPYKTYDLLLQFFKMNKDFSEVLNYFSEILKDEQPYNDEWDQSVVGECNETDGCGLGISFEIKKKNNFILFHNFTIEKEPIELEMRTSIYDGFLILSNLIVFHGIHGLFSDPNKIYNPYAMCLERKIFDYEKITKHIKQTYNPYWKKPLIVYTCEYINYLIKEMKTGKISPQKILSTGGIDLLFMLRTEEVVDDFIAKCIDRIISFAEKDSENNSIIALLTLLYRYRDLSDYDRILFSERNQQSYLPTLLKVVAQKLCKPFPGRGERWFECDDYSF